MTNRRTFMQAVAAMLGLGPVAKAIPVPSTAVVVPEHTAASAAKNRSSICHIPILQTGGHLFPGAVLMLRSDSGEIVPIQTERLTWNAALQHQAASASWHWGIVRRYDEMDVTGWADAKHFDLLDRWFCQSNHTLLTATVWLTHQTATVWLTDQVGIAGTVQISVVPKLALRKIAVVSEHDRLQMKLQLRSV